MVLSADVDSVAEDCWADSDAVDPAEFSGILRAAIADSAAGVLGFGTHFWICPDPVREWRTRAVGRRADYVRQDLVQQRGNFFYAWLRRHRSHYAVGEGAG